jgi:hypothetical protein
MKTPRKIEIVLCIHQKNIFKHDLYTDKYVLGSKRELMAHQNKEATQNCSNLYEDSRQYIDYNILKKLNRT